MFNILSDPVSLRAEDLPSVCIVTGELIGPFNNGGLGTSMTGLAELLAAYGAPVTVIYTGEVKENKGEWVEQYKNSGINLDILADHVFPPLTGPLADIGWTNAWNLYQLLRGRSFDLIHFNDTIGEGMYCFLAKRFGLTFENTLLSLALHSPTEWILENNHHPADWPGFCCFTTGERISIAMADLLWGPSRYLLDWLAERKYKTPEQIFLQQYVMPTDQLFESGISKYQHITSAKQQNDIFYPREIVFFGRLEERKGLRLFVSAITLLDSFLKTKNIPVVFMGKHSVVGSESSQDFLRRSTANWCCNWRIEDNFNQQAAVDFLRQEDRLAVIASPVDNSPCTVYECLMHGIPFIAARCGGIPELLHEDNHATHLFAYSVDGLAGRLSSAINDGISVPASAISIHDNQRRWLNFHANWRDYLPGKVVVAGSHKWAVYIDHHTSAQKLEKTIASIRKCLKNSLTSLTVARHNMSSLENIKLDDITVVDDIHQETPEQIFRRFDNAGADSLICIRSGVQIQTNTLAYIGHALAGNADCIVPAAGIAGTETVMPVLAGSAAFTFLENNFDPGAIFVSLGSVRTREIIPLLGTDRLYMGIPDQLYAIDAAILPYPETALLLETEEDAGTPALAVDKSLQTFATVPQREIYQMLSIGRRFYPKVSTFKRNNLQVSTFKRGNLLFARLKSIARAHPSVFRLIFGNRLAKKMINILYRLSHI